jgi:hypothetical protein
MSEAPRIGRLHAGPHGTIADVAGVSVVYALNKVGPDRDELSKARAGDPVPA